MKETVPQLMASATCRWRGGEAEGERKRGRKGREGKGEGSRHKESLSVPFRGLQAQESRRRGRAVKLASNNNMRHWGNLLNNKTE